MYLILIQMKEQFNFHIKFHVESVCEAIMVADGGAVHPVVGTVEVLTISSLLIRALTLGKGSALLTQEVIQVKQFIRC